MTLKIPPFNCPHCGGSVNIGMVDTENNKTTVLAMDDIHAMGSRYSDTPDYDPGFDGMGRYDLIREIVHLRQDVKRIQSELTREKRKLSNHIITYLRRNK